MPKIAVPAKLWHRGNYNLNLPSCLYPPAADNHVWQCGRIYVHGCKSYKEKNQCPANRQDGEAEAGPRLRKKSLCYTHVLFLALSLAIMDPTAPLSIDKLDETCQGFRLGKREELINRMDYAVWGL